MTDEIELAHGGGGVLMQQLIRDEIVPGLGAAGPGQLTDCAGLGVGDADGELVFTTDSFVVEPLIFPGGDIGRLAVCGTVNDLAAGGAEPVALSLAMIIEEGLPIETLRRILKSVAEAATEAQVAVITGDTKVVERGSANGLFLTTSGVGRVRQGVQLGPGCIRPGDVLLINGPIGDHAIAVMSAREQLGFVSPVVSDVAPLADLVQELLKACGRAVRCMKDPTRGGVAASVNEMAEQVGFVLAEQAIGVRPAVRGACEILGLDVLAAANEGKMLMVVAPEAQEQALAVLKAHRLGREAAVIGRADERAGLVRLATGLGTERMVETPYGRELPRIC